MYTMIPSFGAAILLLDVCIYLIPWNRLVVVFSSFVYFGFFPNRDSFIEHPNRFQQ